MLTEGRSLRVSTKSVYLSCFIQNLQNLLIIHVLADEAVAVDKGMGSR